LRHVLQVDFQMKRAFIDFSQRPRCYSILVSTAGFLLEADFATGAALL
jgi:hypothetical protein